MDELVRATGLVVRRQGRAILDRVDLSVTAGDPFAIVGRSGSGKTTLLMVLAGLLAPDEGVVTITGERLDGLDARARAQRVGIVLQDHQLFPHLSALENVALAPRLAGRADAAERAAALLDELGLEGLGARRAHELSGGQRQRVAIARTLALEPRVILFDEPSAALDPRTSRDLAALLSTLASRVRSATLDGRTQIVVVSHDLPFVEASCTRGVRLDAGVVAARGALADILER